jgi:hypothetical protein
MVLPGAHTLQWSPNGEWIALAYVADQRAAPEIKIIRAADGTMRATGIPSGPYGSSALLIPLANSAWPE